jgi:GTP cyclohydrolase II
VLNEGAETDDTLKVARAAADFRRGLPVLLTGPDGETTVAIAAEQAAGPWLGRVLDWGGEETLLALTAARALALNIKPSGHDVVLLELEPWFNRQMISELADATVDLLRPLRGPFRRRKRPPSPGELAAVQLAKLARLLPSAVVAAIADDEVGNADLLTVDASAVLDYEEATAIGLRRVATAPVPLEGAEQSQMVAFRSGDGGVEHMAIVIGTPERHGAPVLVRLHSECFTGDLLGSLKCDCGQQLRGSIEIMAAEGAGVLLYLAQEGRGIGLMNKLRAYSLQAEGFDTVDANLRLGFDADERLFQPAAEMLRQLGFDEVRLLTNNPDKVEGLERCGITVKERVQHSFPSNVHNEFYLATKKSKSGHLL